MSSTTSAPSKKVAFSASSSSKGGKSSSWLHHVREVQLSQITPEQRSELEAKCRARQDLAKKAKACKGVSMRSKNAMYHSMNVQKEMMQQEAPQRPAMFGGGGGAPLSANSAPMPQVSYQAQASSAMGHMASRDAYWAASTSYDPAPQRALRRSSANDDEDDSFGDVEESCAGRDNAEEEAEMAAEEQALQVSSDDIDQVLLGLRQEPKDDELMAAKFEIYEKFSEKVTVIRSALEEVAGSALRDLPDGAPRQGVRNDLAKLESAEMSGIYDQSRYWFVHDMMQKCAQNCVSMDKMSDRIEALLKFAASNTQTDCPICLRKYATDANEQVPVADETGEEHMPEVCTPKTLSCCHSVCTDCWSEWSALQGSSAFCPMCRNKEFLEYLAQHSADE